MTIYCVCKELLYVSVVSDNILKIEWKEEKVRRNKEKSWERYDGPLVP